MEFPPLLKETAERQKYPLLFATVSGAHLYGFASPDSDFDLRGVHILPLFEIVGLKAAEETLEFSGFEGGIELDLVTHDLKKFCLLLMKTNGYVLEQLFSPLVVMAMPEHDELKSIARNCISRKHLHHYQGFAAHQWQLLQKSPEKLVKPLLYVYRVLLTGIYLMRTGLVEANLLNLNQEFSLPYIDELIELKVSSREKQSLNALGNPEKILEFHSKEYERLLNEMQLAAEKSLLPDESNAAEQLQKLDCFLRKLRLKSIASV